MLLQLRLDGLDQAEPPERLARVGVLLAPRRVYQDGRVTPLIKEKATHNRTGISTLRKHADTIDRVLKYIRRRRSRGRRGG
jgi:hypothetical protein